MVYSIQFNTWEADEQKKKRTILLSLVVPNPFHDPPILRSWRWSAGAGGVIVLLTCICGQGKRSTTDDKTFPALWLVAPSTSWPLHPLARPPAQ